MTDTLMQARQIEKKDLIKYLGIYISLDVDWERQINNLYSKLKDLDRLKKQIACTILLPTHDKSVLTDPPQNLLFWCGKYDRFAERDWVEDLYKVIDFDTKIAANRKQYLDIGFVHPIEYAPITRQAFNWLYDRAEQSGVVTDANKQDISNRFMNLTTVYGGAVICNIFMKDELKNRINKLLNWRTGYFVEHLINQTYKPEQILTIKQHELKKTNSKLVQIRK